MHCRGEASQSEIEKPKARVAVTLNLRVMPGVPAVHVRHVRPEPLQRTRILEAFVSPTLFYSV